MLILITKQQNQNVILSFERQNLVLYPTFCFFSSFFVSLTLFPSIIRLMCIYLERREFNEKIYQTNLYTTAFKSITMEITYKSLFLHILFWAKKTFVLPSKKQKKKKEKEAFSFCFVMQWHWRKTGLFCWLLKMAIRMH